MGIVGKEVSCRAYVTYHDAFVKQGHDPMLLDRVDGIRQIPAFAVHGRYDIVCAIKNLIDLAGSWPELDTVISPDSGHSSHEPDITKELVAATNRIVKTGSPRRT